MRFLAKILVVSIYCLYIPMYVNSSELRGITSFNDNWYFHRVDSFAIDEYSIIKKGLIPDSWESVSLPHTARIEPLVVNDQWQGICYYAKKFSLFGKLKDKKYFIEFEAAMNVSDVWVNGQHMITHLGGYLPFVIEISSVAFYDRPNTIVVRLDNNDNTITGPKPLYRLDFNMYGGIYRNVWLIEKNSIYITNPIFARKKAGGGIFITTSGINKASADVTIQTHIKNDGNISSEVNVLHNIINLHDGSVVQSVEDKFTIQKNKDNESKLKIKIKTPLLWSPSDPNLYKLKTQIYANNILVDEEEIKFGIREVVIKPEGLWLNGEKTFLRGVNRHQEYPYIGYALSDNAQRRDAYRIKEAGFDYVRASHYPVSPAFLDACDEYGLMVLEPILGWQYFGDFKFEEHAKQSSRDMIRRDRNHPCILAWELSINEIRMPQKFIEEIVQVGHEEYPQSAYIAGWMKNDPYDIYIEARQHRKSALLTKPLIVSEYGDWEYYAMNAGFEQDSWMNMLHEERTSRQSRNSGEKRLIQQATNIQEAHNDNLSTHAFADGYWVMFDYNRGYVDDLELSGIMDIFRLPKFSYYFFQSQRSYSFENKFSKPMIFIASNWLPGVSDVVRVFSNCDEIELFVDGKSQGKLKPDTNKISKNLAHPPFTFNVKCLKPGVLKAIGYLNGKICVMESVETALTPEKIQLHLDESGTPPQSGKNDIVFVYAGVYDKRGNLVVTENELSINFRVEGDAKFIYEDNAITEAGIATALLKIGNKPGKVKVYAKGSCLKEKELVILVK
ncbi:Beta-galactosidase [bioreactor metagenome]|uniref:Beta-galactosidase n=1 Tax=bioreactor metagenome TaxID=1076179 RepID=A0A644V3A6_9ZZZZ